MTRTPRSRCRAPPSARPDQYRRVADQRARAAGQLLLAAGETEWYRSPDRRTSANRLALGVLWVLPCLPSSSIHSAISNLVLVESVDSDSR